MHGQYLMSLCRAIHSRLATLLPRLQHTLQQLRYNASTWYMYNVHAHRCSTMEPVQWNLLYTCTCTCTCIKDISNKEHLSIKDTCFDLMLI